MDEPGNRGFIREPIPKPKQVVDYQVARSDPASEAINTKRFDLWQEAYQLLRLDAKHKKLLDKYETVFREAAGAELDRQMEVKMVIEKNMAIMKKKQWTLQWGQKLISIRDQAEKIVRFLHQCSSIGTAAASLDPIHAGIPWAGICVILPLILNDSEQHAAAMDGLEYISRAVVRYTAIESLFLEAGTLENSDFKDAIIKLYSTILEYQACAACHFGRRFLGRTLSNITKSIDWTAMLAKIKTCDVECKAFTGVISTQRLLTRLDEMDDSLFNRFRREPIPNDVKWIEWVDRRVNKRLDALLKHSRHELEDNEKVVLWISDVQVGEDHALVRSRLGVDYWDSGRWFLAPPSTEIDYYKKWRCSDNGQLWLQGSVGTGKSSLVSIVINDLIKSATNDTLAYFYCSRSTTWNTPIAIIRSLVAQLACSSDGLAISPEVMALYKRQASRFTTGSQLSLSESTTLLVSLIEAHGATTIVIDGLDECSKTRELLRHLREAWTRSPKLKLFFSSRLDSPITEIFPSAAIVRNDWTKNSDDIRSYIEKELEREKCRESSVVTPYLAQRMVTILRQRAQGMFRWVYLQLSLLIDEERPIKYRKDLEFRIERLEAGSGQEILDALKETYDDIYERNVQGPHSHRLARKTLQWALCAYEPLRLLTLYGAVRAGEDRDFTPMLLMNICKNFLSIDQAGFIQFEHLSVREYLEAKIQDGKVAFLLSEAHAQAALSCINHWRDLHHPSTEVSNLSIEIAALSTIVGKELSSKDFFDITESVCDNGLDDKSEAKAFYLFGQYACCHWTYHFDKMYPDDEFNLDNVLQSSTMADLDSISQRDCPQTIKQDMDLRRVQNTFSTTPNNAQNAIYEDGIYHHILVSLLTRDSRQRQSICDVCQMGRDAALHFLGGHGGLSRAARHGHYAIVRFLLDLGVDIDTRGFNGETALHAAVPGAHISIAEFLLQEENAIGTIASLLFWKDHRPKVAADITAIDDNGRTPLHLAAQQGHEQLVGLFLRNDRVDVNAKDVIGRTALHFAAEEGHKTVVEMLLESKAIDISIRDDLGSTALYCARKKGHDAITELFFQMDPKLRDEQNWKMSMSWINLRSLDNAY